MRFSIQRKLFLLLGGLTIVVLVIVLAAINNIIDSSLREDVLNDFSQTQGFFQIEQRLRYDRLVESAYLIQENSTFKANVELNDAPTVNQVVEQFANFIKVDLFVVTNNSGEVLSWLGRPQKTGDNLATTRSTVAEALQGQEPPLNQPWPELWATDQGLFQVVTVPTYYANSIIGTITLGTKLGNADAEEIKQNTPLEIMFFLGDENIASTLDDSVAVNYPQYQRVNASHIDSAINNLAPTEPFIYEEDGVEYYSFVSPLGRGEPAYYVAGIPTNQQLSILNTIQRNILIIALIAILIIIPLAIYLGREFSKPVNRLTEAMTKVESGIFDVAVEPSTNDEIGTMTTSFNNMVMGLKERFALQKYVGSHTIDMIQSSSEGITKLGGRRRKMAILFSDIRNSTATIERSDPEEFVEQLNKLLSLQSKIVEQYNGSIDKYVGDSMIALFDGDDAVKRAIDTAIAIQQQVTRAKQSGELYFDGIGIGINYGSMILGNMGGTNRMDYTVIGTEVNLCARLCSIADIGQILIPQFLLENANLSERIQVQHSSEESVKGLSQKIMVSQIAYETI